MYTVNIAYALYVPKIPQPEVKSTSVKKACRKSIKDQKLKILENI